MLWNSSIYKRPAKIIIVRETGTLFFMQAYAASASAGFHNASGHCRNAIASVIFFL